MLDDRDLAATIASLSLLRMSVRGPARAEEAGAATSEREEKGEREPEAGQHVVAGQSVRLREGPRGPTRFVDGDRARPRVHHPDRAHPGREVVGELLPKLGLPVPGDRISTARSGGPQKLVPQPSSGIRSMV